MAMSAGAGVVEFAWVLVVDDELARAVGGVEVVAVDVAVDDEPVGGVEEEEAVDVKTAPHSVRRRKKRRCVSLLEGGIRRHAPVHDRPCCLSNPASCNLPPQ